MVALKGAPRDPEPSRKAMELFVRGVAHEVRPPPSGVWPDRRVDEDHSLSIAAACDRAPRSEETDAMQDGRPVA